jgi:hypothetical protein
MPAARCGRSGAVAALRQQQDAADRPQVATIGTSSPGSISLVSSSSAPSASSNVPSTIPPSVQRRPTRSSAANPPRIRSTPVSNAAMPSSPTNASGSTSPESRSRSSTSTDPTTAAMAAASPSRNPERGRMAKANRRVMSPPVSQNRARKVTRRTELRPPTVMARARANPTSPRSAVSHQYPAIAGSRAPASEVPCAVGSGGPACVDIQSLVLLCADTAAEAQRLVRDRRRRWGEDPEDPNRSGGGTRDDGGCHVLAVLGGDRASEPGQPPPALDASPQLVNRGVQPWTATRPDCRTRR